MGSHNSKGGINHSENAKQETSHNPFTTYVPTVSNSVHSSNHHRTSATLDTPPGNGNRMFFKNVESWVFS